MAEKNGFDDRLDSLVTEIRTRRDETVVNLPAVEMAALASWGHARPRLVTSVAYERTPTGFCRTVTFSAEDIEKFSSEKTSG